MSVMARPLLRLNVVLLTVMAAVVLWAGVGGRALTRLAYAVERGRIQADSEELAAIQDEVPGIYAVSRAFKLVAKVARPGVVHIRVSGGEREVPEEEIDDFIRRRWGDDLPEEDYEELRQQARYWLERMPPPEGTGSGIVLDTDGYILTNEHVVENREKITVILHDERKYEGQVVGTDPMTDLAVVKIDAPDLHALPLGDSDAIEVGDWVIAVGAPFGLSQTVTHGIVSAKGRTRVEGIKLYYQNFIQTDAAINPGNSGGPLLNLRGEVMGVNTAIATHGDAVNAGIAFAIPSNMARRIAAQLKETGEVARGWLGIELGPIDATDVEIFGLPAARGVFVERVLNNSPAARAGLQVEDTILSVNGVKVERTEQFRMLVADLMPRDVARCAVVRDGEQIEVAVRLGRRPERVDRTQFVGAAIVRAVPRLGLGVRTLRAELIRRMRLAYDGTHRGVVVVEVNGDSVLKSEVEPDELIVACNRRPVESVAELLAMLEQVSAGRRVRLEILEPTGDRRIISVKVPER